MGLLFNRQKPADQPIEPVAYLQYSRSEMRDRVEYVFEQGENECTLTKKVGYQKVEPEKIAVPPSVATELARIIQEEKMLNYKESYSPSMRVHDGYMWNLSAKFKDGKKLYTGGDNAMPDDGKGVERLVKYLDYVWLTNYVPRGIKSMEYRSDGSTAYPLSYYVLKNVDGHYWLTNASNRPRQKAQKVEVPESFIDQLRQIIVEEQMLLYRGHYQSEYEVMDGNSWMIDISFDTRLGYVYASGYEAYPPGNGLKRVKQLCAETWNELEKNAVPAPLDDL